MQYFELLRKHFAMCGIEISQRSSKTHPFSVKNSTIFILVCINVSTIAIMLKEAHTFDEYTDILFRSVSGGTCGIFYEIIVWKTPKLLEFINSLEDTVNTSE